jgi:hypothetical protein
VRTTQLSRPNNRTDYLLDVASNIYVCAAPAASATASANLSFNIHSVQTMNVNTNISSPQKKKPRARVGKRKSAVNGSGERVQVVHRKTIKEVANMFVASLLTPDVADIVEGKGTCKKLALELAALAASPANCASAVNNADRESMKAAAGTWQLGEEQSLAGVQIALASNQVRAGMRAGMRVVPYKLRNVETYDHALLACFNCRLLIELLSSEMCQLLRRSTSSL